MKVYLDLVFFINFFFDFLILLATKLVLKENISFWRLIIGSLVASLSIFLLFLSLSSLELFLIKVVASVFIILVTFGKKNFFQDLLYFYLISIILGGFLYLFDISFTYENQGIVFFGHGLGLNLIAMCILSPIFLYFYIKENKRYKRQISITHSVEIYVGKKVYHLKGMLDTGNQLKDPYSGKSVILLDSKIQIPMPKFFYVPYKALNTEGIIPCCKVERVIVDDVVFSKCLVGISKTKFSLGGVDCILPNQFKEEL
ncbi:MAG TPA: sigma-E processing peptidase SpoIIGA [Candidatus Faecimonas gallistercoris]|nr:sigma-E processing peptidase SpoIIGA [Candidatus Faecimonas gallistercoris]